MIAALIGFLAPHVGEKWARPAAIAILFALALAVLGLGKCAYDRTIIKQHDATQAAANAKADRKADAHAADQRRADDARLTNEAEELHRSTDHAQTDLDRRLAFQRCLRLQQSARAAKRESPACS